MINVHNFIVLIGECTFNTCSVKHNNNKGVLIYVSCVCGGREKQPKVIINALKCNEKPCENRYSSNISIGRGL